MFERFTDRCRKVMALSNQEAQRFNHEYIGTEHILMGLLREGTGVGLNVLKNLGVDPPAMRRRLEMAMAASSDVVTMGKLPQTPRAKKVIEFAINEARGLHHNYVGTEHMLLGLLLEGEGIAAIVLNQFGIQVDAARNEIRRLLESPDPPSDSSLRLFRIQHGGKSFWVEASDLTRATEVWKRHFWSIPSGDEACVDDPTSIELIFDGPVWR